MFDYSKLYKTNKFYIQFDSLIDCYVVEDLIRYWYRQWFKKHTEVKLFWIHLNNLIIKDLIEVTVDLENCVSKNYAVKEFISATKLTDTLGDKRRSLRRVLEEGVNTTSCKLKGIDSKFSLLNEYIVTNDIPNPYLVPNFNTVNTNELIELVNNLIDKEDNKLTQLTYELDTSTKYVLMRQQLDKLDVLGKILELATNLY